jgi:predicted nucleotidyltransferase component of viral defense system
VHMKYPGYQVSVWGRLGNTKTKVFIDVGVGDSVKPTEITMKLLGTEKAPLFEKEIDLWAYPVESIFAEKFETAIARTEQNSRMKDYHDLVLLVRSNVVDKLKLKMAIQATFANRGTKFKKISIPKNQMDIIQKYWSNYFKAAGEDAQKELGPHIQKLIDEINSFLQDVIL